jgi:hypothetical protein
MASTRLLVFKLVAPVLCATSIMVALPAAAGASPGHFKGVITASTQAGRAFRARLHPAARRGGSNNLLYHGGPVMHSDSNYAIYWEPSSTYSTTSTYKGLIDTYFQRVAAASGSTSNDYGVVRQYYDGTGYSAYNVAYSGAAVDTDPYPASGCKAGGGEPCITDAQLENEVNSYLSSHGLPRGLANVYFVYFPGNVATCTDGTGSECSTNAYCAYHSSFGSGSTTTLYANMSDADWSGCESGEYPNGDVSADSTINITSHENIESITDPLGTAWYDATGNEIGDKCAWTFGSRLGGGSGAEYNEQISGGNYWLQREWSNASSGCVQRY